MPSYSALNDAYCPLAARPQFRARASALEAAAVATSAGRVRTAVSGTRGSAAGSPTGRGQFGSSMNRQLSSISPPASSVPGLKVGANPPPGYEPTRGPVPIQFAPPGTEQATLPIGLDYLESQAAGYRPHTPHAFDAFLARRAPGPCPGAPLRRQSEAARELREKAECAAQAHLFAVGELRAQATQQ
ncbi:hypothetical protein T492DRAFT_874758 [Pavlovales sp. CCMP2436]|nr:hypothetical protein T492DRAFT_874758 [Pavlovales sp. CCMP2436]